jgi:hypothetical protein
MSGRILTESCACGHVNLAHKSDGTCPLCELDELLASLRGMLASDTR